MAKIHFLAWRKRVGAATVPFMLAGKSPFGDKLRVLRGLRQLTQHELGQRADVTPSHISRLENGDAAPGTKLASRIASILEVPVSVLVDDKVTLEEASMTLLQGKRDLVDDLATLPPQVQRFLIRAMRERSVLYMTKLGESGAGAMVVTDGTVTYDGEEKRVEQFFGPVRKGGRKTA